MINSVRNTVFSVVNKNNYGYISPSDFNLFAQQAQLEIFEEYFSEYNTLVNKENLRTSGTGYADLKKGVEEMIDIFSVTNFLSHNVSNTYFLPSLTTTGDDYFMINKVLCYPVILAQGQNTNTVLNSLEDSTATFIADGVAVGDIVANLSTGAQATVVSVVSTTILLLSANIFTVFPQDYAVYDKSIVNEVERVSHNKITLLTNSLLTAPSDTYPAYTQEASLMTIYPETVSKQGQILSQYIRYPKSPKWTYVTLLNGEPAFDQSQPDYQDFEVPLEDEYRLIQKILQYVGISIRETEVYQFAKVEEREQQQQQ
jgi:hypothetical protein